MTGRGGSARWARVIAAVSLVFSASIPPGATASAGAQDGLALAAPRRFAPITGSLTKPGLTVIALASNGKATSVRAKTGRFRLRPPAQTVTLHLKRKDGKYAGPVVLDVEGKRAVLGVEAGADLGRIKVRRGYARVSGQPTEDEVDPSRWSRAKKGVPIGAGVFGRVNSPPKAGKVPGDPDLDGIPNSLDIDDDGDRRLDNFESPGKKGGLLGGIASTDQSYNPFGLYSIYGLPELPGAPNANAAALTIQDINASLRDHSHLFFDISDFVERGGSVELDCTGLSYCSPGGTGEVWCPAPCTPQPFPECCDADGDGFGTMAPQDVLFFRLAHRAAADEIGTGDVLIARVTTGGVEAQFPATLQTVFATVPALVSYADGAGNSVTIGYPVPPGGPGTAVDPFPVAAGSGGDVVLTFTFWRPQRTPIPGEGGELQWVDIGGLSYYSGIIHPWTPTGAPVCPASTYSSTDPDLVPAADQIVGGFKGGFTDLAPDRPADPGNTITYTVNMTQCLAAFGQGWATGENRMLVFYTRNASYDDTRYQVHFSRQ
jgi:hypothetical protein